MAAAAASGYENRPIRMFSQRSVTCGTDVLFTILFEAEPIGKYFTPLIAKAPARLMAHKNEFVSALGHAIARYKKMRALPAPSDLDTSRLKRSNSLNVGEGIRILKMITGSCFEGTSEQNMIEALSYIIDRNVYENLPPGMFSFTSLPNPHTDPVSLKMDRVFAIIFGLSYFNPPPKYRRTLRYNGDNTYYETESNSDEDNDNDNTANAVLTGGGHIVGFMKYKGDWYFLDNDVGWMHKMRDPSFVEDHIFPAILEMQQIRLRNPGPRNIKNAEYLKRLDTIKFIPRSEKSLFGKESDADAHRKKYGGISYTIIANGHAYAGSTDDYSEKKAYLLTSEVHLLMARDVVGGTRRCRKRRTQQTRRKPKK